MTVPPQKSVRGPNAESENQERGEVGLGRDRVVDLAARKTEGEWARAAQAFFERATAIWFKWLGWVLATGAVGYLARQTSDRVLQWIEALCYFLLWMYFTYFFASLRIEPLSSQLQRIEGRLLRWLCNGTFLLIGAAVVFAVRCLLNHVLGLLHDVPR